MLIRPLRDKCDSGFLLSYLTHPQIKDYIESFNAGGSRRAITKGHIESFVIPLPPLPEQRAIAAVLGALDDKIELNRRMNETLEAMARALFQNWFVDATQAGLPKGWRYATISELCDINSWMLNKGDELDRIEYVEISEVSRGNIASIQVFHRGEEPSRARRRLRHGDTVLSTVRPERGSYFLCLNPPPNLIASTGFAVVTPTKAPWSFIHAALTHPEVSEHLGQQADGGAYPAVRPEIIGKWEVPWPDKPEKVKQFHRACAPLYERAEQNRRESRTLAALRDALLPKLLSGELRVPAT
jgi:type I restriction enzyme S subunit